MADKTPALLSHSFANSAAIAAISPNDRFNGLHVFDETLETQWCFRATSALPPGPLVLSPAIGQGQWVRVSFTASELASTDTGKGASLIGVEDAGTLYTATNVEGALAEVKALADAAPSMQAVDATLIAGTVTIATGIVVAANSEVIPTLIGPITGSTNFASLEELKASRVPGGNPGGTVVIEALGNDGALDADAAGAIRVIILTPQV